MTSAGGRKETGSTDPGRSTSKGGTAMMPGPVSALHEVAPDAMSDDLGAPVEFLEETLSATLARCAAPAESGGPSRHWSRGGGKSPDTFRGSCGRGAPPSIVKAAPRMRLGTRGASTIVELPALTVSKRLHGSWWNLTFRRKGLRWRRAEGRTTPRRIRNARLRAGGLCRRRPGGTGAGRRGEPASPTDRGWVRIERRTPPYHGTRAPTGSSIWQRTARGSSAGTGGARRLVTATLGCVSDLGLGTLRDNDHCSGAVRWLESTGVHPVRSVVPKT
jgi:hypothetical protein